MFLLCVREKNEKIFHLLATLLLLLPALQQQLPQPQTSVYGQLNIHYLSFATHMYISDFTNGLFEDPYTFFSVV